MHTTHWHLTTSGSRTTSGSGVDRWLLRRVAERIGDVPVRIRIRDGVEMEMDGGLPVATVDLADRRTLAGLMGPWPARAFGEAYVDGRLRVHGDLTALLAAVNRARADGTHLRRSAFRRWLTGASPMAARRNADAHYGLGEAFYRLWLDRQLVYSCGYFADPGATLDEAQVAKCDYICRKVGLEPGERVLEIGSGWGALACHMAREYGATVDAYNVSAPQIAYTRARVAREGLGDRVNVLDADYRLIHGTYDAVVSVGMLEHVGRRQLAAFGEVIDRALDPQHGRGLLHFIGHNRPAAFNRWILDHVFPDSYAPTLGEVSTEILEPGEFSVLDIENLRLHYVETLRHWQQRFDESAAAVETQYGARFVRLWRLYLSEARAGFMSGDLQLFQISFARRRDNALPWTRAALYAHA